MPSGSGRTFRPRHVSAGCILPAPEPARGERAGLRSLGRLLRDHRAAREPAGASRAELCAERVVPTGLELPRGARGPRSGRARGAAPLALVFLLAAALLAFGGGGLVLVAGVGGVHADQAPRPSLRAPGGLPASVEALPPGDPERGRRAFHERLGCAACHGDPALPGSRVRAPDLADIARVGATRVVGLGARQYVYESITDPNAYLAEAPIGPEGIRLQTMPLTALSEQEAADLVAYLVDRITTPMPLQLESESP